MRRSILFLAAVASAFGFDSPVPSVPALRGAEPPLNQADIREGGSFIASPVVLRGAEDGSS
jgi:hypothetical protein